MEIPDPDDDSMGVFPYRKIGTARLAARKTRVRTDRRQSIDHEAPAALRRCTMWRLSIKLNSCVLDQLFTLVPILKSPELRVPSILRRRPVL